MKTTKRKRGKRPHQLQVRVSAATWAALHREHARILKEFPDATFSNAVRSVLRKALAS